MSNLADVVKTLFGVRKTVTEIGAQIKAAQARIEHLKKSPPPRSDLIAFFEKLADQKANEYDKAFEFAMTRLVHDPLRMEACDSIGILTAVRVGTPPTFQSLEVAILSIFGEDIKTAIRKRLTTMPWPGEPGPPVADRPALIAKAERELKELEAQLTQLRSEAAAAGITL
jgi:hypothetical protein